MSDSTSSIRARAATLLDLRRPTEARVLLEPLVRDDPTDPFTLVLLADASAQEGNVTLTHDLTRRAAACAPADLGVLTACADIARSVGDLDAALHWASTATAIAPDEVHSLHVLSLVLIDLHREVEALPLAERALKMSPEDPATHVALGLARDGTGDPAGAMQALKDALLLDPQNAYALNNLAALRLECGDLRRASRYLGRALAIDPRLSVALTNLDAVGFAARRIMVARVFLTLLALAVAIQVGGYWPSAPLIAGALWLAHSVRRLPQPARARLGARMAWRDGFHFVALMACTGVLVQGASTKPSAIFGFASPWGWGGVIGLVILVPLWVKRYEVAAGCRRLGVVLP